MLPFELNDIKKGNQSVSLKWIPYIFYASAILYFASNILVPIAYSALIAFVLYPVCTWLQRKGLSRVSAIIASITMLILFGILVVGLLAYQVVQFADEWPQIAGRIEQSWSDARDGLVNVFGITREKQANWMAAISQQSGGNIIQLLKDMIARSAFSIALLVLIPVYTVLILYYRRYWVNVLFRLFPEEDEATLKSILSRTIKTYYNFIKGMAIVYLVVGALNSLGLLVIGVPHAILFGFIASILTFIPYLGIIAGSMLPVAMAWITYDSFWYPLGVVGVFSVVQYLEANIIFPFAVGNRLSVNTMAILVSIFLGELLWGVSGMILFVPFVGIIKLIADSYPKWQTLSMILATERDKLE